MLKLNKNIRDEKVDIFSPHDKYIGSTTSALVFNDFRLQIARKSLRGYYFVFKGQRIEIEPDGTLSDLPTGCFDTLRLQLRELCDIGVKYDKKNH